MSIHKQSHKKQWEKYMKLQGKFALKNFRKRTNQWAACKNNAGSKHWGWFCDLPPCSVPRSISKDLGRKWFPNAFSCHVNFNQTSFYSAEAWKPVWCCLVPGPATESTGEKIPPVRTEVQPSLWGALERVSPARGFKAGTVSAAQNWELALGEFFQSCSWWVFNLISTWTVHSVLTTA